MYYLLYLITSEMARHGFTALCVAHAYLFYVNKLGTSVVFLLLESCTLMQLESVPGTVWRVFLLRLEFVQPVLPGRRGTIVWGRGLLARVVYY